MHLFYIRLIVLIVIVGSNAHFSKQTIAFAATPARNHILLLDSSGSMKPQYSGGIREWLITPLIDSGIFSASDQVIVRWFDERGNSHFIKEDPQRRYYDRFTRERLLESIPISTQSVGRNTNIPEALEITLADIEAYKLAGDTLIWLLTDNIQDLTGSGNDAITPFYERIYNDPNFKFIYFFPIVREGESTALVMYMLDYCKTESKLQMSNLMEEVGQAIGHRPVLFRPIRLTALELDRSNILFEDEEGKTQLAELEDGRILVSLNSGQTLSGRLKFKLRSKFREWKIEQANVSNAVVTIEPSSVIDLREGEKLQWKLDPRTLEIDPQQVSKKVYVIDLASGGRTLATITPTLWQSFFSEPETKTQGIIRFEVENPQLKLLFFDDSELADQIRRVKGLEQIEQFLLPNSLPTTARNLTLEIPILIKIKQPAKPYWLLLLISGLGLTVVFGSVVILSSQTSFQLSGLGEERILKIRPIATVPLFINGEQVGTLSRRFGILRINVFSPFVLENSNQQQNFSNQSGTFVVTNTENKKFWDCSIEPLSQYDKSALTRDNNDNNLFIS